MTRLRLLLGLNICAVLLLIAASAWNQYTHTVHRIQPTKAELADPAQVSYCREVQSALSNGAFDRLEAQARDLAALGDHFAGGIEKLIVFYNALANPGCGGFDCHDDYRPRMHVLQAWLNRKPAQPTAWIANVWFWENFAWSAKGCGDYKAASFDQWQTFYDRIRVARSYAAHPGLTRDPAFYLISIDLLRDYGGTRDEIDALFREGHEAFPRFIGLDEAYARVLDPSWYGKEGDVGWFSETLLTNPGGEDGQIAYASVAQVAAGYTVYPHLFLETGLSWNKVKPGLALIKQRYGAMNYDWNVYCYMAVVAIDRPAALDAYHHFAPLWNPWVWKSPVFYYDQVQPWITRGGMDQ